MRPLLFSVLISLLIHGPTSQTLWAHSQINETVPSLTVDLPFPTLGTPATFTVLSDPQTAIFLLMAASPSEIPLGPIGTLFLEPSSLFVAGSGITDNQGMAQIPFTIPNNPNLNGFILYVQALAQTAPQALLSNAIPFRGQSTPATGPRVSRVITSTPDGAKAYVGHQQDGSVTIIDASTDTKLADFPIGPSVGTIPHQGIDVGISPDGQRVFITNVTSNFLTVMDVASDSVIAQIPVPKGCRGLAFDFSGPQKQIYVTNETLNGVLVIEQQQNTFIITDVLPVQGSQPTPITLLPNGLLMVGNRGTLEIEILDPHSPSQSATVARTPLGSLPMDLMVSGSEVLIPTFTPSPLPGFDGFNLVLRISLADFQILGTLWVNEGTDYVDMAQSGPFTAVAGAGSGVTILADSTTHVLLETIDLAPGQPASTPQAATFITPGGGPPTKLYVVNRFRETVRSILLNAGPPFSLGPEIALGHSGFPRIPLSGDLSPAEDGEWFFRTVQFFNGTPGNPNPVTCQTCHTDGATNHITHGKQTTPLFGLADTGPYNSNGTQPDLLQFIQGTFQFHGKIGGTLPPNADQLMLTFFNNFEPPSSIYRLPDGSLTPEAQAGKTLFETTGQCAICHTAPTFIPQPPVPLTFPQGIGTGLAPANVPSLRGLWLTPPYLHDGSAPTLKDVFLKDLPDLHRRLTFLFTDEQLDQLVAYLQAL